MVVRFNFDPAIKTALKQENLNPEIEEKLLQLQRYQEKRMQQDPEVAPPPPNRVNNQPAVANALRPPSRKRPPSTRDDDSEWIMETPKRSRPVKHEIKREETL